MKTPVRQKAARIAQLRELGATIQCTIDDYVAAIQDASEHEEAALDSSPVLSREALAAQRRLVAAAGRLSSLVQSPQEQLILLSSQHLESRALHIIVATDVAGLIEQHCGGQGRVGDLAEATGLDEGKLARILRLLCGVGVFVGVSDGVFANNDVSAALAGDENFRAWVMTFGFAMFSSINELPAHLLHPSPDGAPKTALAKAMRYGGGIFDWFKQEVQAGGLKHGKNGVGDTCEWSPHAESSETGGANYPWASLGGATVVDVGSGIGGFSLRLSKLFPELSIVLQDLGPMIQEAESGVWPKQHPEAVESGRARFMLHDFFTPNPVEEAEVYYLRNILLDWPDENAVRILAGLKASMGRNSQVLISEIIMPSAVGSENGEENLGCYHRYKHINDMMMMCGLNGCCRTEAQFKALAEGAGLALKGVWNCRGHGGLVELVLPGCV